MSRCKSYFFIKKRWPKGYLIHFSS